MFPAVRYWSSLFIVSQGTINCNSDPCGCIEKHIHFSHPVSTWQKRGRGGKKNKGAEMGELCVGVGGRRLVICRGTHCIWFYKLGFVKAEGILVTWGCNKACATLEEPVAAVVTFMAHEEGFCSRETVCGQTAVTEHTAAGLAAVKRKYMYFFHGPRTVLCWINKYSVFSSFS